MSFILDALKKSDAERQKRNAPGFADIPESRDRHQPQRWIWIVGALLLVNLVALFALLARPEREPVAPAASASPADSAPAEAVSTRQFSDIVAEARRNRPAAARTQVPVSRAASGEQQPSTEPRQAQPVPAAEATDTFESMRAGGTLQLPDLHLDIHVYSEQPAERFVFINMKKYRESETLAEGPVVRSISPEGVVLAHGGKVFLLPRD